MKLFDRIFKQKKLKSETEETIENGERLLTGPFFGKEFNDKPKILDDLELLIEQTSDVNKIQIMELDLKLMKYGLFGESNVNFELKHCNIPMMIFHDIRVKWKDLTAQLDFLLITNNGIYVLETKRLSGDITINSKGEFIRVIKDRNGKLIKEEGMYSPITQVQRQTSVLERILRSNLDMPNEIAITPLVVIANPKTVVRYENTPSEVKNSVIRCDQIISRLTNENKEQGNITDKDIMEITSVIIYHMYSIEVDLNKKYGVTPEDIKLKTPTSMRDEKAYVSQAKREIMEGKLKQYRYSESQKRGLKPFHIFSNKEMEELLNILPKDALQLSKIKGFGAFKTKEYGPKILEIINE